VNGSNALGWGSVSGSLEPGKRADMILLDSRPLSSLYLSADQNLIDALLYRGRASSVDTVMVDGEILYQGKKHRRLNSQDISKQLKKSIQPAATNGSDSIEAELLPYAIRYYQTWDDELLTPHHVVNSI